MHPKRKGDFNQDSSRSTHRCLTIRNDNNRCDFNNKQWHRRKLLHPEWDISFSQAAPVFLVIFPCPFSRAHLYTNGLHRFGQTKFNESQNVNFQDPDLMTCYLWHKHSLQLLLLEDRIQTGLLSVRISTNSCAQDWCKLYLRVFQDNSTVEIQELFRDCMPNIWRLERFMWRKIYYPRTENSDSNNYLNCQSYDILNTGKVVEIHNIKHGHCGWLLTCNGMNVASRTVQCSISTITFDRQSCLVNVIK